MVEGTRTVYPLDLEVLLDRVRRSPAGAGGSLFGPDSISWKVNRESGLFLAAGRATLLQLAHPWVSAAISEHSRTLQDPISRFHQTFRVMFTVSFGPVAHAMAAARRLHARHAQISGTLPRSVGCHPQGSRYEANDAAALLWVHATLIDSSVAAYELVLPALTTDEREQYYSESKISAAFFGLAPNDLPATWQEFRQYMESMLQSNALGVNQEGRYLAQQLLSGAGSPLRIPGWYRALTAYLLPSRFRDEFQLAYAEQERRSSERALRWLPRIYRHLPAHLRFVGPYLEATERLAGRSRLSLGVQLSNRVWIGQSALFDSAL